MDADKQRCGTARERGTERPDASQREERNRRRLWEDMPALTQPQDGRPISPHYLAYKARKSSENQARTWNVILAGHPSYDPTICGFVVGVADRCDPTDGRRWPLVWRRLAK